MRGAVPQVRVHARGAARLRSGHPWVYRADVVSSGSAEHGDVVRLLSDRGEPLGHAFYSAVSKIAIRRIGAEDEPPDRAFWASRLEGAIAYRDRVPRDSDSCRLVFGESDGIPGLIADLYGRHLVVQALTAAVERLLDLFLDLVAARIPIDSVLARNDPAVRALEGLPREVRQLRGSTPEAVEMREGEVVAAVDCFRGQKTGAFLDQRENRLAAAGYARGRVLDVFCYQGAFGLQAARRGAVVEAIDSSGEAAARGEADALRNGLHTIHFTVANAFDELRARERRGERYDQVVLDPPAFAKSRSDVADARRGYKEINLRAMRLLEPGGILVTSSCSYNLLEHAFLEVLGEAAADAGRTFRLVEKRAQSRDHPVRLGFPESHYLKCMILSVM